MARRIQKPIGIYVLTILLVLGAGLAPLFGAILMIQQPEVQLPFTIIFISLFFPVFSIVTAIWAFMGENSGRIAVLIIVSLNFFWWTFLAIIRVANSGESEAFEGALFLLAIIRPAIGFGLFWWYFTKKDVVAYYKQDAKQ